MDNAIFWMEYVLRHNGAHHLKTKATEYTTTEYYNLDIILVIVSVLLASTAALTALFVNLWNSLMNKKIKVEWL